MRDNLVRVDSISTRFGIPHIQSGAYKTVNGAYLYRYAPFLMLIVNFLGEGQGLHPTHDSEMFR